MPAATVIGSAQAACLGMQDIRSPLDAFHDLAVDFSVKKTARNEPSAETSDPERVRNSWPGHLNTAQGTRS
jgi:hypothetical protein